MGLLFLRRVLDCWPRFRSRRDPAATRLESDRPVSAAAAHRAPVVELTTPARRLWAEMAALQQERDDLAESLAQVEAYQPGILNVAKAWVAQIDRAARFAADDSEWPERN